MYELDEKQAVVVEVEVTYEDEVVKEYEIKDEDKGDEKEDKIASRNR